MGTEQRIFLWAIVAIAVNIVGLSHGAQDVPTVRIVEIKTAHDDKKDGEKEHIIQKPPNSNIIIGDDIQTTSKLVFECDAQYPVQWVYNGDGMPEYSTNASSMNNVRPGAEIPNSITRPGPLFTATLSLGFSRNIGAQDSGKYTCRSLQTPTLAAFYYLYVKDGRLFANPGGTEIFYKRTDPSVRIPCSLSNPQATVSLQKSVNGLVSCPLNESIKYDPSRGFDLKISDYFEPAGVYVCTAGLQDTFQVTRYTLVALSGPENLVEQQKKACFKHDDCPSDQACLKEKDQGYICTSPCPHVCGRSTRCETVNNVPRCYCLSGYFGDPYRACYLQSQNIQESQPTPQPQQPDPCNPNPCGQNTRCERYGRTAQCSCQPGFQGDPYVKCYKNDVCNPNPCGPNSECSYRSGHASCVCRAGYFGSPPYCRAECEVDSHCNFDRACINGRCRNPCEGACDHLPGTRCHVRRRIAVCSRIQTRCPVGYYGRDCQSIYTKDSESIESLIPEKETITEGSASPCTPSPCASNAVCTVTSHENKSINTTIETAFCQCIPNYTGNADIECYPVDEQLPVHLGQSKLVHRNSENTTDTDEGSANETTTSSTAVCVTTKDCERFNATCVDEKCQSVEPVTEAKRCGINAISILSNGQAACSCPEGYTGIASIECHPVIINNSEGGVVGINGTNSSSLKKACDPNPCGINTKCISNIDGNVICECTTPFEGNPWVGCELNCTKNEECPTSHVCHENSNRCVNPCDPEFQPFFTQCGRNSACKVKDHLPICYCPKDFPHGSPHVHCKEESWMPNHLKSNSTCENAKKLQCGANSSCKRFHDANEYCVCLPGFFGDPYVDNGCKLGIQCRQETHCKPSEECMNGKCLDVCRNKEVCGQPNQGCIGQNHKASCMCHIGTILNPRGECEPMTGALAERLLFYRSFEDI